MSAITSLKIQPFFGKFAIVAIRANGVEERLGSRSTYEGAKRNLAARAEARGLVVNSNGNLAS